MAKILVVDDEIKIREIIKEYAEFEGYEVAQAEDGMQAVKMSGNQQCPIIMRAIRQKPVTIQLIAPMMLSIFSAVSFFIVITSLGYKINYSVLSAITGSFFAATLDGNRPAISVRQTLIAMSITAALTGIEALIGTSVRCAIIMFIGIVSR